MREKIERYITSTFGARAEYLCHSHPTFAVFRHEGNKKWFAVVMDVSKEKLGLNDDERISVMNLKSPPLLIDSLLREGGIHKGYHMNKNHWISVRLDGSVDEEKVKSLVDLSFDLTSGKRSKR